MSIGPELILLLGFAGLDASFSLENSNTLSYDQQSRCVDYNRLRLETTLESLKLPGVLGRVIVDNESRYFGSSGNLNNRTELYRAYVEFQGEKHFLVLGRQRVPFGVGRIWNPIDLYNPINAMSIETEQRQGTEALRYEYAIGPLANMDFTLSRNKAAARLKGYLTTADLALVAVSDNENDLDILGWEAAGEFLDTGIELRSEGGIFFHGQEGNHSYEGILGAEYGFANSLTLLGEYRYDQMNHSSQFGATLSYQLSPLLFLRGVQIIDLDDGSRFFSPNLEYSLQDDMTLRLGLLDFEGEGDESFGSSSDRYFIHWYVHF